ncbi:MAG: peptidylprolyl isomerase [Myxococcota bacterium]|jgi:peptidyl-prolyl cis-trans isomerase A (cyclophilin A)|nr:peptidylprolyl isomerase [Myxococcota bacterium]
MNATKLFPAIVSVLAKASCAGLLAFITVGCGNTDAQSQTPAATVADGKPAESKKPAPIEPKPAPSAMAPTAPGASDEQAPATYAVKLETTKGEIVIDVTRDWAPHGADRFYTLVKNGYYNDVAFFRVVSGFMAQVGISGDPKQNTIWRERRIQDDPVKQSNTRGMVTFATSGPNSRTAQFFINFGDNARLDSMGFPPFGKVRDMKRVDALNAEYGEGAPRGNGPFQARVQAEGNAYLKAEFPKLDYIVKATIL